MSRHALSKSTNKGRDLFFTVVTLKREKFLTHLQNVPLLRQAFQQVKRRHPFKIDAIVLLPDHLHCMWTLPGDDCDFSTRWRLIKSNFTRKCDAKFKLRPFESRKRKKEPALWQRRFWEHLIRGDEDYLRHIEYIHYTPVKHGLVGTPKDWKYSSFHRYVKMGKYKHDWGSMCEVSFNDTTGRE